MKRTLKLYSGDQGGTPGTPDRRVFFEHLWELKSAVYDAPYENEVPPHDIEGFRLVGEKKICYTFALESGKDITDLFNMTPYCYKTSQQDREKLEKLSSLTVSAQFSVLTYKKI